MILDGLPLLPLRQAEREPFMTRRRAVTPPPPDRDRRQHARDVLGRIDAVVAQIETIRAGDGQVSAGVLVTARGPSLDVPEVAKQFVTGRSATELAVSDNGQVVLRVGDDLAGLRGKTVAYAGKNTAKGNPKFRNLIARIENVSLSTISDLSLGEIADDVSDSERIWVEIWTRGGQALNHSERQSVDDAVSAFADLTPDGRRAVPVFRGPERDVHVVLATGEALKALPVLLPYASEVHLAPTVYPVVLAEVQDEAGELAAVDVPPEAAAVVAIHDSGVDANHPYVAPVLLGAGSVVPGELGTRDRDGHGTQMAGLAAYSKLADGVVGGILYADAWLVSSRLLESAAETGGDPERGVMWAERTTESVASVEALVGDRSVIHNVSIGADNLTVGRTDRTAWSVAVDLLSWNDGDGRLVVVAGGNAEAITERADYPYINLGPPFLQQPAQAWNALTVGGVTRLDSLTAEDRSMGYPAPLALAGELSPHSRTASAGSRPIKPDIVMEAGNTAPGGGLENPDAQGLSILTLKTTSGGRYSLLRRTCKTSPAAASASNALAQIARAHPQLRSATWRALLVNTARWPEAAITQISDRRERLRAFGYGVPDVDLALYSASNRPVMIYEGFINPSVHVGATPSRRAEFIELPFPEDELHTVGDAVVDLAVTLSYFVEPTDNLTRRAYAGGRLRWDLQGPTETADGFRARINRLVHEQGVSPGAGSYDWSIKAEDRSRGTLQHDRARVAAAELAGTRLLAVYPVLGWWEDSRENWPKELPYSLVVSVDLGTVDVDLHTLLAQALVPLPAEIPIA